MMTDLTDRIAGVIERTQFAFDQGDPYNGPEDAAVIAAAIVAELNIPDCEHVDDEGRVWEWCGGQPGTWAWRITRLRERDKWDCGESDWSNDD